MKSLALTKTAKITFCLLSAIIVVILGVFCWQYVASANDDKNVPPNYYTERYRNQYHFSPATNWSSEPNGLVYYKGVYHMFYQHNPASTQWGTMSWGHATSTDLVHWDHQPIAIASDDYGPIFSGSAVWDKNNTSGLFDGVEGGGLVAIYTHIRMADDFRRLSQTQALAYSVDGINFEKFDGNPILPNIGRENFRDPRVFWHEETSKWIMLISGDNMMIYSSCNLIDWQLESVSSISCEHPDMFQLAIEGTNTTKWVCSLNGKQYVIGNFDGSQFVAESQPLTFNYGPDACATQSYSNTPDGKVIVTSWMGNTDNAYEMDIIRKPWNGGMTLHYELSLKQTSDGIRLYQKPLDAYAQLRSQQPTYKASNVKVENNSTLDAKMLAGEINVEFDVASSTANQFGLELRAGGNQKTIVGYNKTTNQLYVDRLNSGNGEFTINNYRNLYSASVLPIDGKIKLQIFVDWNSVEVVANDGVAVLSAVIFPSQLSDGLAVFALNGQVAVSSITTWDYKSAWRNSESQGVVSLISDYQSLNMMVTEKVSFNVVPYPSATSVVQFENLSPRLIDMVANGNNVTISAKVTGQAHLRASVGSVSITIPIYISTPPITTNVKLEKFGHWYAGGGITGFGRGDSIAITEQSYDDVQINVQVDFIDCVASAIIIGSNSRASEYVAINYDYNLEAFKMYSRSEDGSVKILAIYPYAPPARHTLHQVKVVKQGCTIKYYFGNLTTPLFVVSDTSIGSGRAGLLVFAGHASFNNFFVTEL